MRVCGLSLLGVLVAVATSNAVAAGRMGPGSPVANARAGRTLSGPPGVAGFAAQAATLKNPVAASPDSIAAGKQAYLRTCAPCHGSSAEGGAGNDLIPASPDLTDAAWDHGSSDGEIFTNIRDGIGPDFNMTPFKDRLKDDEIWNIVNYLRSIAKR